MGPLYDALLLDPYPLKVWIAYRTDDINGSGTNSDPYRATTASELDTVMAILAASVPVRVHLGPATTSTASVKSSTSAYVASGVDQGRRGSRPYLARTRSTASHCFAGNHGRCERFRIPSLFSTNHKRSQSGGWS